MSRFTLLFFPWLGLSFAACNSETDDTSGQVDTDTEDADTTSRADPSTMYTARGEYAVGHTVLNTASMDLEVKAWYPAIGTDGAAEIEYSTAAKFMGMPDGEMSIYGAAHAEATPDSGPYPLVILSHGFGMNPEWYPLAEHLASHGFVVLGPEHSDFDWATDIIAATIARPADIRATIDLAEGGALGGAIDATHVAVVGHSYGGYSALAVAGARFDLESLATRCATAEDPFILAYFCEPFLDAGDELADLMGLDETPTGLWPSLADPRVDAIVPIAGDAYLFGDAGLAEVTVPAMMLGGTGDTGTPWGWGAGLAFDAISSDYRALVALEGAEHFVPTTSCDNLPFMDTLDAFTRAFICEDPAWDKNEGLDIINHLTTAFLLDVLAQDVAAGTALDDTLYAGRAELDVQIIRD
ncbi:MAG: putative dienelactone hydrolase [Myxococcota bacterium]|jgi:predicted dienelactone hydrolase